MNWIVRKKRLKAWAKAHGVEIPPGFKVLVPKCGKSCIMLIARVQKKAWGPGYVTGTWSPRMDALVAPAPSFRQRALKVALGELGVKEHPAGSNDGPRVHEYQRVTGAFRAPWCASFVAWSFERVGHGLSGFNTAYVPSYVEAAKAGRNRLRAVKAADARPGDLVCFDWQGDGTCDHIGILNSRVIGNKFTSVEGNTSVGNDSNGGEVMLRERLLGNVGCFIRVI
jgi:hypothetical protein